MDFDCKRRANAGCARHEAMRADKGTEGNKWKKWQTNATKCMRGHTAYLDATTYANTYNVQRTSLVRCDVSCEHVYLNDIDRIVRQQTDTNAALESHNKIQSNVCHEIEASLRDTCANSEHITCSPRVSSTLHLFNFGVGFRISFQITTTQYNRTVSFSFFMRWKWERGSADPVLVACSLLIYARACECVCLLWLASKQIELKEEETTTRTNRTDRIDTSQSGKKKGKNGFWLKCWCASALNCYVYFGLCEHVYSYGRGQRFWLAFCCV